MNKQILIAEDEEFIRMTLSLILERSGYDVIIVDNGREALDKLKELKNMGKLPDLLLTDIQMGELTGMELIDELNALEVSIPILVMTGYGNKEMLIELMRKGCSEYIDKPFEPDELLERISAVFEKQEKVQAEKEKEAGKYIQEKAELRRKAESYLHSFEKLREQLDSAVGAYQNLVQIKQSDYKIRVVYRHLPFAELGGDFIDIRENSEGCDILIADVAGHDMGSSYHTVMIKAFFDENFRIGYDGMTFFRLLNRQLIENSRNERMVTAIFLRLNLKTMMGEVTSAGHPPMMRLSGAVPKVSTIALEADVLGINENAEFKSRVFSFDSGDRFFLYTDGLINAYKVNPHTGKKERITESGLNMLLRSNYELSLEDIVEKIEKNVTEPFKYKLNDDMLIMGLEIP